MGTNAKEVLAPQDFATWPIWRYDDEDDLYHPVTSADQLPESERALSIRANFRTPDGRSFAGYVVGIERVFSFGLFGGDRVFHVNMNLPDLSAKQLNAFLQVQSCESGQTFESLFPLTYTSSINEEPFVDFSGQFDGLPTTKN
ncbi:hypothetical protein GIY62_17260 [Burkholderia plantarii]|uniref:hypothetical protein n=1 Tax=Burkholderia plantarii TaxID=41899 RepID=UPI00272CF3D9|nr:hypothetical protein [Burkholderia plantarii]WLE58836.1 hypothetical protein GIY62_17260 [Burkholderia plantarii]